MKTLLTLLGYLAGTAALAGSLMGGVFWLIQPDPSLLREAKAAPVPPRIAESIERKKTPEPVVEPVKVPLVEASVALTMPSVAKIRIRELVRPPANKQNRQPRNDGRTLSVSAEIPPSPAVRTLSRNNSPY